MKYVSQALSPNNIFIYATDTVWGLGGNAFSLEAYNKIMKIKGWATMRPIGLVFASLGQVCDVLGPGVFGILPQKELQQLLSMEVTVGIEGKLLKHQLPPHVAGGSEFICFRVLGLPWIIELIDLLGAPLFSTSVNDTGKPPMNNYQEMADFLQRSDFPPFIFGDGSQMSGQASSVLLFCKKDGVTYGKWGRQGSQYRQILDLISPFVCFE